jgi:putative glycosyltransferase (exosortase G-associated)
MNQIVAFTIFWGVWLLVPMMVDAITTLMTLAGVIVARIRNARQRHPLHYSPGITIIIPVYNSADTLAACLHSIASQDYPREKMEVLLVNNGSTDNSYDIFVGLVNELNMPLVWHSIPNKGKAWALNAGIYMAQGELIFNIDSDAVLAPDAIRQVVEAMKAEPDLGAVTGAIEVLPPPEGASPLIRVINECEFFEYVTAFHVGREQQTLLRSLYTLSGAFSVFRREVLMNTFLYNQATVTEDTDLTFTLYDRFADYRVGCVSAAVAYVHPIESVGALYSQRVRWQRGQLEVSARHTGLMKKSLWNITGFNPARVLAVDHTLAFPRVVWTFLLPVLTLFGYPSTLIVMSFLVLYLFYLLIDALWLVVAWLGVNEKARQRLAHAWWLLPIMPLYRMVIFWFRFAGFLYAVAEPGAWRVRDPLTLIRQGIRQDIEAFAEWVRKRMH